MSPWVELDKAAEAVGTNYVFSFKPNPAIFAEGKWRPQEARRQLREALEKTRGLHVELIMKDVSTIRYEPHRLWEWQRMAMELVDEFAS